MKTFGFTALINSVLYKLEGEDIAYSQCMKSEKTACYGHFIDKFADDKIFRESGDYVLLFDGVVLNKRQLMTGFLISSSAMKKKEMCFSMNCEVRLADCWWTSVRTKPYCLPTI